jgi:alpha-galactosidase
MDRAANTAGGEPRDGGHRWDDVCATAGVKQLAMCCEGVDSVMLSIPRIDVALALLTLGQLTLAAPGAGVADGQSGARIELPRARFATGDDPARRRPDFDDGGWKEISTTSNYESQGFDGYDGFSWYRIHVRIPSALKTTTRWQERLLLYLASIDDVDQTFFNGVEIGKTGTFPDDPAGYDGRWQALRNYYVELKGGLVRWDQDNVIAIRVYDGGGPGGFYRDVPYLRMAEIVDGVALDPARTTFRYSPGTIGTTLTLTNSFPVNLTGAFGYEVVDRVTGRVLLRKDRPLVLEANGTRTVTVAAPERVGIELRYRFTETASGKTKAAALPMPYRLTPVESPRPRINGARVTGVRPGSPFLFRIPATGRPPLRFAAAGLPSGLTLDSTSGLITGMIPAAGDYPVTLGVRNPMGSAERELLIRAGDALALTPPMGWNSWNAYGLSVDEARVRATATVLLESGLAAHGWSYVNIDDGWEAEERAPDGTIRTNPKFPDLGRLSGWLHSRGLKLGIYSSPGPRTCGGFLGSYQHERQDAESYARWGIDYLKYDLCSYLEIMGKDSSLEAHQTPYLVMRDALRAQPRDIVFSLCQYGLRDVWTWGAEVGGNSWRTTGDIEDTWESMMGIGGRQDRPAPYGGPGHWNDPDMLVVGVVGWGGTPHPSRLTPDEQYSHISLWSLLAAPLLLGNDLTRLDDFTRNLLTNDEVLAVDQDPLGAPARRVVDQDGWQVWLRPLAGGRTAIGVFNMEQEFRRFPLDPARLDLPAGAALRDLWRQRPAGRLRAGHGVMVPGHGVVLLGVE